MEQTYSHNNVLIALLVIGILSWFFGPIGLVAFVLIIILSGVFVYLDARSIGTDHPLLLGVLTILFWIIALPVYLWMRRGTYERAVSAGHAAPKPSLSPIKVIGGIALVLILGIVIAAFVFGMAGSKTPSLSTEQPAPEGTVMATVPPSTVELAILSSSSYVDRIGALHVVGEVSNSGSATASFVKVTGTFYDSSGTVVDTEFTYTSPSDIKPRDTAPFDLIVMSPQVAKITTYKLNVKSGL
jgi:hypothetical protein